jgi:peptide/nickel transport system permease protein
MLNLRTVIAFTAIVLCFVLAVFAQFIAPFDPFRGGADALLAPGTKNYLLGTDHLGRDIFSELIFGARVSLAVGISAALSASILGVIVGSLAGFFGGWVDGVLMRVSEFFQTLPRFVLALVIVAFFGGGVFKVIIVLAILSWPQIARLVRAQILSLRESTFVEAARLSGMNGVQIITREILPNALAPVIVTGSLDIASAILLEASLSFFGLGDANLISWGGMLNVAQPYLRQAWWMAIFPGIAISLIVLSFNILGDALNDALNPRLQETA